MRSGPVTARITKPAPDTVDCEAWGTGATEFIEALPALLGADDDASGFAPKSRRSPRRTDGCRICGSAAPAGCWRHLIPAVLEQRVYGMDARRAWRALVTKFGAPAPGPAPAHMRVPPSGDVWRRIPSWEFHRANVDPGRARTIVGCAQRADSLERLVNREPEQARAALMSLPGVGEWTAAETAQRAFGDADALSVGDYHLASMVGWRLLGEPIDDPAMVELLEPLRPHRHRAVRLLEVTGPAHRAAPGSASGDPEFARHLDGDYRQWPAGYTSAA